MNIDGLTMFNLLSPPKIRPVQILEGDSIKHSFQVYITVVIRLQQQIKAGCFHSPVGEERDTESGHPSNIKSTCPKRRRLLPTNPHSVLAQWPSRRGSSRSEKVLRKRTRWKKRFGLDGTYNPTLLRPCAEASVSVKQQKFAPCIPNKRPRVRAQVLPQNTGTQKNVFSAAIYTVLAFYGV